MVPENFILSQLGLALSYFTIKCFYIRMYLICIFSKLNKLLKVIVIGPWVGIQSSISLIPSRDKLFNLGTVNVF